MNSSRWLAHMLRMSTNRLPHRVLFSKQPPPGRNVQDIVFLGTASAYPSPDRGASGLVLRDLGKGTCWLFDCGEGTQIQAQKSPNVRLGRISNIFISHLHGDHLYGLPGLLSTIDQKSKADECEAPLSQEKSSEATMNIYGPQGLRRFVRLALAISRTHMNYTYAVHELIMRDEHRPENWTEWAALEADETRDPPLHCERPGRDINAASDGFWYDIMGSEKDGNTHVHAMSIRHTIPSVGWLIIQPSRRGKLDVKLARSLGVPDGPLMGQLQKGISVLVAGNTVTPDQVIGPQRRGNRVAIMGDTYDSSQLEQLVAKLSKTSSDNSFQLDALVHEATLESAMAADALQKGHSTPIQVAEFAARMDIRLLILTHFSHRYKAIENDQDGTTVDDSGEKKRRKAKPSLQVILDEARSVSSFKGEVVLADDLAVIHIPSVPLLPCERL